MMQMVHSRFNALLSACVLSLIATAGWSQYLTWLGTLPGYNRGSIAWGVSDDGFVAVGWAENAAWQRRAFRWENGVMQDLGALPGANESEAWGVSADGSVVVGMARNAAGQARAFRWTAFLGMQALGTLGGNRSAAYAVSDDGAAVVGWAENAAGQRRAFRWTIVGMQDLGTLPGYDWSLARGVSRDGDVVVGWAVNPIGLDRRAFRWTAFRGMQELYTAGNDWSEAHAVSADGSVVVGWAGNIDRSRAFRWRPEVGVTEDLNATYASLLTNGSVLTGAVAISPDGRYIVGEGYNAATRRFEAFLLDTVPEPASLMALSAGLVGLLLRRRSKQ